MHALWLLHVAPSLNQSYLFFLTQLYFQIGKVETSQSENVAIKEKNIFTIKKKNLSKYVQFIKLTHQDIFTNRFINEVLDIYARYISQMLSGL